MPTRTKVRLPLGQPAANAFDCVDGRRPAEYQAVPWNHYTVSACKGRQYGRGEPHQEVVNIFKGEAKQCPGRKVVEAHEAMQVPASAPGVIPGAHARHL